MSERSLTHLRSVFGAAVFELGVDEVARVLGKSTRGQKQHIRARMKSGDMPGAVKKGGRLVIAVDDFAEVLEPSPTAARPTLPVNVGATGRTGRRRAQHGPRIGFMRLSDFWARVCGALGWTEERDLFAFGFEKAWAEGFAQQADAQRERFGRLFDEAESEKKRGDLL